MLVNEQNVSILYSKRPGKIKFKLVEYKKETFVTFLTSPGSV